MLPLRSRRLLAMTGALVTAVTALGAPAFAAVPNSTMTWKAPAGASYEQQVRDFWTPERRAGATPVEATTTPATQPGSAAPLKVGTPGRVDPAPPAPPAKAARTAVVTPTVDGDGKAARWVGPSDPRLAESPASTTGMLMFWDPVEQNTHMCSAGVVNSEAKNMVLTAGHCLFRHGQFSQYVAYYPDYYYGSSPYGSWVPQLMLVSSQWSSHGDSKYDWGFVLVRPNAAGARLANVTGSQGIAWNYPKDKHMWAFGYPADPPFDGQALWYCSEQAWQDGLNKANIGMMCNMTAGSSGGPWIMGDTPAYAWVNGVTSYTYGNGALYSSYFGDALAQTYQQYSTQGL